MYIHVHVHVSLSDMFKGVVGDMNRLGVTQSFLVKRQMLLLGAEAAEMMMISLMQSQGMWLRIPFSGDILLLCIY